MSTAKMFQPSWASPPGETVRDILRERSIPIARFAESLECSVSDTEALLDGTLPITLGIARKLTGLLGGSVEYWMSRDFHFREDQARIERDWLADLPLKDMIRFHWIPSGPHASVSLDNCLQFFGVSRISEWRRTHNALRARVAFRTSPSFASRPGALAAWLRQGELRASHVECQPWNPTAFRDALDQMRVLTRTKDPSTFLPELERLGAAAGVAIVIVRAPEGCRASGATRFLTPTKALMQLSLRYLSDDHFWFSVFHEAGHLLLHSHDLIFIEGGHTSDNTAEQEANDFAAGVLVPAVRWSDLLALTTSAQDVVRFAYRIGVSPGIVVGQLQHAKKLRPSQLNGLKRRYAWNQE
jgi:HTH-type transcriptional regulator/antitoxin HigA